MTENWPQTEVDAVRRLRALAAGIPGATVTERVFDHPMPMVWDLMWDNGRRFAEIQPDLRSIKKLEISGDRVRMLVHSRFGFRAHLEGVARPGWCWLQSRFLLIGMAAAAEPDGRTRVALTGGIRIPTRAAILPLGVRRESTKTLDRLEALFSSSG